MIIQLKPPLTFQLNKGHPLLPGNTMTPAKPLRNPITLNAP
jgi:hypothetical protein